jgi:uncharacterized Ntn-hydrolase superfamily protein
VTYSVVAVDDDTGAYGVAVASKALCVGAHVPWGKAGFGACATQAWHDLRYGWEGLALLENGHSAASVVQMLTHGDPVAPNRQLGIVDRQGRVASYTGSRCMPWAGGMCGRSYAVQGNLLAGARVVEAMADAYEAGSRLPFAVRLVHALLAGDGAGGDRRGRQSAALKVWRAQPTGTPGDVIADLRVDDAPLPVHRLLELLPVYWLEHGTPVVEQAPVLTDALRDRIGRALAAPAERVESALELWASEHNLERRVLPGRVDAVVLDVLERSEGQVLAEAAAATPPTGWPR